MPLSLNLCNISSPKNIAKKKEKIYQLVRITVFEEILQTGWQVWLSKAQLFGGTSDSGMGKMQRKDSQYVHQEITDAKCKCCVRGEGVCVCIFLSTHCNVHTLNMNKQMRRTCVGCSGTSPAWNDSNRPTITGLFFLFKYNNIYNYY